MNWSELGTVVVAAISSLGVGGAIVFGLSDRIGKIFADRYVERLKHEIHQEIESYKTKLKKSEFLFRKEFEAASQFISLRRELWPSHKFPDMDWYEACEDFAGNFKKAEEKLERYMATHGAALNERVLERLDGVIGKIAVGKFEVSPDDVSEEGISLAEKVMDELQEIEKELCEVVQSQAST